nr:uncharacterized protein CI109_002859 [Kwoniella shandongensis]KAA5528701.1 hypothetical protein CI109_002859 [Kwoniella shandongensis]
MTPSRRKITMHLSLPPRLTLARTDSGDSAPVTPGPHTPLPYEFGYYHPGIENKLPTDLMQLDESSIFNTVGSKRGRDEEEEEEKVEPEWTEEELDVIQSTLIHPFRPISTHYPPGELPPPNVIDELTNQIINYAFRGNQSERQSSPTSDCSNDGWTHSWDATRKKLFDTALAESKFGHDAEERKMTREERQHRPGLRRMDSMDFLDQAEPAEQQSNDIGRALKLSTTLQNTAKQEPLLLGLSRSTSVGSGLDSEPLCTPGPSTSITLTPASPTAPAPPLRRKPSFRSSSSKPLRPSSLLQRGRSFTADDLRAEAEAEEANASAAEPSPTSPRLVTSPLTMTPLKPQLLPPTAHATARLTRSQSSSSTLNPPPHAVQKMFLSSPKPSTTDRASLAMPLSPPKPIESPLALPLPIGGLQNSSKSTNLSSWSDSEDEGPSKTRAIKKMKQGKPKSLRAPALMTSDQLINSGGLRSPFEEKDELSF